MSVDLQVDENVALLTLNRPDSGNRLNVEMLEQLRDALCELADSQPNGPSVVVLGAAGPDFSHGREQGSKPTHNPQELTDEFNRIQHVNALLQYHPLVTIAAVKGQALGAGLSLAGRCDIVVTANDATLSFPEIRAGIPPTIVLSHYRYVLPRNLLGDLVFTGRELSGSEAVAAGLAARSVSPSNLDSTVLGLASQVATYDQRSLRLVKRFLSQSENLSPRDAPDYGIALYATEMAGRNSASNDR